MKHKQLRLSRTSKLMLLIIGIIFGSIFIGALLWLYNNTSLLRGSINSNEITKNNQNAGGAPFELTPQQVNGKTLYAPKGFRMSVYSSEIKNPRFFSFAPDGTMFVGTKNGNAIYAMQDVNGSAGAPRLIESDLDTPHSVYYHNGDLFLAEQTRISVYRSIKNNGSYEKKDILVDNLPTGTVLNGGGHTTRTVVIGPDNKMYVSIGSSCNVCIEDDERRATIMRFNLDGSGGEIFAKGLRNTVGFAFNKGVLWGLDMGRDRIGDDIPPEEVNIIEQGKKYGWPYCYGDKIYNPEFADFADFCSTQTESPVLSLQAHDAPLGISFMNDTNLSSWPSVYKQGFFAAMHGSWNRTIPTGYKLIWVDTTSNPLKSYNFITGWLTEGGAWGRPAGVGFSPNGSMFISDDKQNIIYRVDYAP